MKDVMFIGACRFWVGPYILNKIFIYLEVRTFTLGFLNSLFSQISQYYI
jgi:hypothetical protein